MSVKKLTVLAALGLALVALALGVAARPGGIAVIPLGWFLAALFGTAVAVFCLAAVIFSSDSGEDSADEVAPGGLVRELAMYRELRAVTLAGMSARVVEDSVGQAALAAGQAKIATALEKALFELDLSPLGLPYPAILRQALAEEEQAIDRLKEAAQPLECGRVICSGCDRPIPIGDSGHVVDQDLMCSRCCSDEDGDWPRWQCECGWDGEQSALVNVSTSDGFTCPKCGDDLVRYREVKLDLGTEPDWAATAARMTRDQLIADTSLSLQIKREIARGAGWDDLATDLARELRVARLRWM